MKVFFIWFNLLLLSSCSIVNTPTMGLLYTQVKYPKKLKKLPLGEKKIKACAYSIGGLVAFGDASVERAVKKGNLKSVTSVSQESNSILNLFGRYCTIVTGS